MNEIIESALGQGITSLITVAIFLLLYKWLDNRKKTESEKYITKISANLEQLSSSLVKLSDFVTDITKNVINRDREKCKAAINDTMYSSAMNLIKFVSDTVVNNHIDTNKDTILSNVHNIVNAEFYTIFATLSLYKIDGIKPSDFLKKEWMNVIEKAIIDTIYNESLSKEDKILSFNNKLDIKFQSYVTYITNNTLK